MKSIIIKWVCRLIVAFVVIVPVGTQKGHAQEKIHLRLPDLREKVVTTFAPEVPPPIKRKRPAVVEVYLNSSVETKEIKQGLKYKYWTFNGHVPGPFIRARV